MEAVDIVMTGILLSLANRLQMEAVDIVMIGILLSLQTGFHWRLLTLSLSLANRLPLEAVDIVSISILLPLARKLGLKQDVCCIESSCSGLPSAAVTIMT